MWFGRKTSFGYFYIAHLDFYHEEFYSQILPLFFQSCAKPTSYVFLGGILLGKQSLAL